MSESVTKDISSNSIYFPGLNGLRFIAAFLVVISHVEEIKDFWGMRVGGLLDLKVLTLMGELAVTFFFVLSGFLIIYLLMMEKKRSGTISMKKFYMRRVLRIFPLYYLTVFLGLFLLPEFHILDFQGWSENLHNNFWLKCLLFLTFFSNLAAVTIYPIPYLTFSWSIGVEEQFYFFVPFLIKFFTKTIWLLIAILGVYLIVSKGLWWLNDFYDHSNKYVDIAARFANLTRFDCMAIGGLAAYAVFTNRAKFLNFIYQKSFQIGMYIILFITFFTGMEFGYFTHEVYALMFVLVILNIATNKKSPIQLEHRVLKYLGKISYGIYMYHFLCIRLTMILVEKWGNGDKVLSFSENIFLYVFSVIFTILLSTISYEFFEKRFLNLKHRYTIVKSTSY